MNEVIIRILDSTNNVLGDLDLENFNDFPLVITKGIVNLDNLKSRTGTYTKTFKVPNTKNNSVLLSNVDDINSRKDFRDALGRKPCIIMVNGNQVEKGFVQVSRVYNGFEVDSFELVFFGNNIDWVKQAAELKLNSLTTYANNAQVYNVDGIRAGNFGSYPTYDHCYPYISRGGQSPNNDTQVEDYYPCFYLKGLLERGLNSLGYKISSTFLDDADIKKLACDLNGDMRVSQSVVDQSKTRASLTSNVATTGNGRFIFDDDSTPPNEDTNGNYNTGTGYYTVPSTGRYVFTIDVTFGNFTLWGSRDDLQLEITVIDQFSFVKGAQTKITQIDDTSIDYTVTYEISVPLVAGEVIGIGYNWVQVFSEGFSFKSGTFFKAQRSYELKEGDSFNLNEVIPDDIKLLDVINDFTRMFNIYYWTDIKTKTIYLEPRDTFFKATTEALDWSNKLDLGNKYEIDYVSSYKRDIKFSYRDLNNDEWLKGWQNTNKRTYGAYSHVLPERFGEGTTEIKLDLFSASYAHIATEATPLNERPYTTLKYWNEYLTDGSIPDERINGYNSRIFFFQYAEQYELNGDRRTYSINGRTSNFIPYGIFEDYNNTEAPQNLSFTSGTREDGSANPGLFERYYSKMLKNIEEGGRLIAYFNLSSTDFDNLDFRKLVYINAPAQAKGYYLIESVEDYNPIDNKLTKVSLFKFENLGSVDIDGSQEGNNNSDDDNASEETLEPIFIEDGAFLIEVWNENADGTGYKQVFK